MALLVVSDWKSDGGTTVPPFLASKDSGFVVQVQQFLYLVH